MQSFDFNDNYLSLSFWNFKINYKPFKSLKSKIFEYDVEEFSNIKNKEIFTLIFNYNEKNIEEKTVNAKYNITEIEFYSFDFDFEFYSYIDEKRIVFLQNIKNINFISNIKDFNQDDGYDFRKINYRFFCVYKSKDIMFQTRFYFFYETLFVEFRNFLFNLRDDKTLTYISYFKTSQDTIINEYNSWLSILKSYSMKEQFYLTTNLSQNNYLLKGLIIKNILKNDNMKEKIDLCLDLDNLYLSKIEYCNFNELEDLCTEEYIKEYEKSINEQSLVRYYSLSYQILNDILTQHLKEFELHLEKKI